MPRIKKLTDYTYSPTNPASEDAIRLQIDDSIQEVYDASAKNTDTVNLTGAQTIADIKTFTDGIKVPVASDADNPIRKDTFEAHKTSSDHDGRYFTEAEVNALLLANQQGNHTGTWQGYSPVSSDPGIQAIVNNHTLQLADIAINIINFGAVGDGVTDDTIPLKSAVDYAIANNKKLIIPEGRVFLISTFSELLSDSNYAAVKIDGNLSIFGGGVLKSNTTTISNSIFGIDSTSGEIEICFDNIKFDGASRYRAIYATADSETKFINIENIETNAQSILLIGSVTKYVNVINNKIGTGITSTTNTSPTLNVTLQATNDNYVGYKVKNNIVWTGTEVITTGAYVIHGMPIGGDCIGNTHFNIGMANNEGFDIDNVGKFAKFCRNVSFGAGFEYKVGTEGYSDSKEIIFSENISYSPVAIGFAIQSSCVGFGNIVYNPTDWGLYVSPTTDVDGLIGKSQIHLQGFKIIYAGSANGLVRIYGGYKSFTIEDLIIELDPLWDTNNPTLSIASTAITITGDFTHLKLKDVFIARTQFDMINIRPTTTSSNILFENIHFDEKCGDSCIDIANCTNTKIINPTFPTTITDRPIRLSSCSSIKIDCDYHASITLAQTSGSNTGILINNWGQEASGVGVPPTADSKWPLGCIVLNTSDSTMWLRISASTAPTTAWKQI